MNIVIVVATHKKYWMPDDNIYLPLHVGAEKDNRNGVAIDIGYIKDNSGANISVKNKNYCELTGLYWAWKNIEAEYIGLVHYRRHFTVRKGFDKRRLPITKNEVEYLLQQCDVILPKQRNYFIETNYNQYIHAHHNEDLDTTRDILCEKYPEYVMAYDVVMKKTHGHRFNMFIMKKGLLNNYCQWLFDILYELEGRLDISSYNDNDQRVFGFVSERLLDVWLEKNKLNYLDIPYVFMENQNWIKKGVLFCKRKFNH